MALASTTAAWCTCHNLLRPLARILSRLTADHTAASHARTPRRAKAPCMRITGWGMRAVDTGCVWGGVTVLLAWGAEPAATVT
jgi:hypothetical protein